MKNLVLVALAMLASMPALAQDKAQDQTKDQASCKAYFQVLRADAGMPGLHVGLDSAQKRWWENDGKKKYPGLCLTGSVMSAEKPRYLVIWSKSKTIGQSSVPPNEVYGQQPTALQATAPATAIYQPRWDQASVTVLNVQSDGSMMLPPVYFETDQHSWIFIPDSRRVFKAVVKYLWQEQAFPPEQMASAAPAGK
jgi:hypothetical protein